MHKLTMKGKSNKDFGLAIVDYDRPLLPDQNDEYISISGRDGFLHRSKELGNNEMQVQFFRNNRSVEEWVQARYDIIGWLFSRDEVDIQLDDDPGVTYRGKVSAVDIPERYKPSVSFWVTFNLHPFKYGELVERRMRVTGSSGIIERNRSNHETPYLITFTPDVNTNNLRFDIGDVSISYTGQISAGDEITVDTNELEFRVNGDLKVLDVEGSFSMLQPGSNMIGPNVSGIMLFEYRERFI